MWQWLEDNSGAIAVLIALVPTVWAAFQFILAKRREAIRIRFETYHSLIKQLVQPEGQMYLDRQVAAVYELKDYKHYYPVTVRILSGLKQSWSASPLNANGGLQRLLNEIDLTLNHISAKV
jgi:hypothetical protein